MEDLPGPNLTKEALEQWLYAKGQGGWELAAPPVGTLWVFKKPDLHESNRARSYDYPPYVIMKHGDRDTEWGADPKPNGTHCQPPEP